MAADAALRAVVEPMLSVVIPALDEEAGIADVLTRVLDTRTRLAALGIALEVIVVDDGSSDGTAGVIRSFPDVRLIQHPSCRGYGAALKTGFAAARGEWLSFLDADGTYPPESLPELCEAAVTRDIDLVVGSRMSGTSSEMPSVRRLGNTVYAWLLSLLGRVAVRDITSGMRVMKREAFERLSPLPDGLEFTPAMSSRAAFEHLTLAEVPIPYRTRAGESKLSLVRDGIGFTRAIVWTTLAYNPVRPLGLAALGLVAVALAIAGYVVTLRAGGTTALDTRQLYLLASAGVLLVSGVALFSLGAMFNYLVSLFHRRPIRQGLFGRPLFTPSLDYHFGWMGTSAVVAGVLLGVTAFGLSLTGWPADRLLFYLLAASVLAMAGIQLTVAWLVMRVLEGLVERDRGRNGHAARGARAPEVPDER